MAGDSQSKWSDTELTSAVAASTSWRGLMRTLGLPETSPQTILRAKQDVVRLSLNTSHFTKQRTWSGSQLKCAIAAAQSTDELLRSLGLQPGSNEAWTRVKANAIRLGLDLSRLESTVDISEPADQRPDLGNLRQAATSLAACWFSLCGLNTAIPIEPAVYDLLVSRPDGIKRVQVKTTTHKSKNGWMIQVGRRPYSARNNARLVPYDPDLIDLFFIVDGDLSIYLIPSQIIAGRVMILLRTYPQYIVGNAAGLMASRPNAA
ncbi:MAG TPA: group I intron-associated PD-(D/E)XK endonuclease [Streptosporangiaceae bacterium]|nr:group I intron-associated PD-(D/E)XK endonuclease [Streptosporangiaceae bacterium]